MNELLRRARPFVLVSLAAAVVLIWYVVLQETPDGLVKISVLDVGQGDAIFIESPTRAQILVDGGPGRKVMSALPKAMPFYDRTIDLLVVSNPDKDHIAGFVDIIRSFRVGAILVPGTVNNTEVYRALLAAIAEKNIPVILGRRGERVHLGGGAYIDILFPDRDVSGLDTNTGSLVSKLVYGQSSILLTGDAPSSIEEYLVRLDGENLKSDVLKVGHHGSKTSTAASFLGYVSPEFAAVSVGADNTYGHPHKEVLETLERFEIEIFRTDLSGDIKFVSDGERFRVEN
ncbi:MAG: MBL fold metallo-hydrolase [Candidatus Taylorbacteria bacterium]|nr:MBL fold metallo-hydrolase [Candidatus Taylorbacteria bacterium]